MLSTPRPLCFNDRTEAHIFTWQSLSNVLSLAVQLLILLLAYLSNILQYSPSLLLTMRIVWYLCYRVTKENSIYNNTLC